MFCKHCGVEIKDGYKFCPKCGAQMEMKGAAIVETKETTAKKTDSKNSPITPPKKAKPTIEVKDINIKKPEIQQIKETIDFNKIENLLETENLKVEPFKGFFSKPAPSEVRIENISKIYEPVFMAKASYRGMFEEDKSFPLNLDPGTAKVVIDGKEYPVEGKKEGDGFFSGNVAPKLVLNAVLTVIKTGEKSIYVNMSGTEKPGIANLIGGKERQSFDVKRKISGRVQIPKSHYDIGLLKDKVLLPTIVKKPAKFKKVLGESITVELSTVYYPKYKVLCLNMKNHQSKHLYVSAVDGTVLPTETF